MFYNTFFPGVLTDKSVRQLISKFQNWDQNAYLTIFKNVIKLFINWQLNILVIMMIMSFWEYFFRTTVTHMPLRNNTMYHLCELRKKMSFTTWIIFFLYNSTVQIILFSLYYSNLPMNTIHNLLLNDTKLFLMVIITFIVVDQP